MISGFPVALALAWTSVSARTKVAGFVAGIGGVAFVVALGNGVFRLLVGPDSFTLGAFLASTVPLMFAFYHDVSDMRKVSTARQEVLEKISETRDQHTVDVMADLTATPHGSSLTGMCVGLASATIWFFSR